MIASGLLFVAVGIYALRNPEREIESGLRWRGMNTAKLDVEEHPKAIRRVKGIGGVIIALGGLMMVWGILNWSGDALAIILFLGGVIGILGVIVLTS